MKTAEVVLGNLASLLWGNQVLFVLLGLGVLYTTVTDRIQFRSVPWVIEELCPREEKTGDARDHRGTVSSIQALYMATASRVGSRDIVGTATTLTGGGPGALFWTWTATLLGIATKYAETVLGLVFRQKGADGSYYGGPMYYIEKGLHARLSDVAVVALLFFQNVGGALIQFNTISNVTSQVFGVPKAVAGILVAAAMVLVTGGGPKRLADMARKIVPVMASLYIVGGIVVVLANLNSIPPVFRSISQNACSMRAGMGAAAGLTVRETMRSGVARGLYSNETGEGSAAVTRSVAQVGHPARQGFYGVMEVSVDAMVIYSTTGSSILAGGVPLGGISAASLVAEAFGTVTPLFKYVISVSLILFASTSIMSQWHFSHVSLMCIKNLKGDRFYRTLSPVLTLLRSLSTAGVVWSVQDCMLGLLIIPNVLALLRLSPVVMRMTREFFREDQ